MYKTKFFKFYLLTSLLLMNSFASYKAFGSEQNLQAEINLNKSVYLLREPIFLTTSVRNTGKEGVPMIPRDINGLLLKNSKGEVIPPHTYVSGCRFIAIEVKSDGTEEVHTEVNVAEPETVSFKYTFDILRYYGITEDKRRDPPYLPPDEYTVQNVHYLYKWKDKEKGEREELRSNVVKFKVIEPTGFEKEACELLREGYILRKNKQAEEAMNRYNEIIEKYPNSIYASSALYRVASIYNINLIDKRKSLQEYEKLIDRHVNSEHAVKAIGHVAIILYNLGEHEKIKEVVTEIAGKHKDNKKIVEEVNRITKKLRRGHYHPKAFRPKKPIEER